MSTVSTWKVGMLESWSRKCVFQLLQQTRGSMCVGYIHYKSNLGKT